MNFISKITGKSGEAAADSPTASKSVVVPGKSAGSEGSGSTAAVRVKPYSGLEVKTLWNHFSKDDLLTITEVGELLDRVLIKDASDIYAVIRTGRAWREYCAMALKIMDTSQGSTIDLQEFTSEFNAFYVSRLYYIVKFLIPIVHSELLKACEKSGMEAKRLAELEGIIKSDRPTHKVVDKAVELAEIARLNQLVASLTLALESSKQAEGTSEIAALKAEVIQLKIQAGSASTQQHSMIEKLSKELSFQRNELAKIGNEKTVLEAKIVKLEESNIGLEAQIAKLEAEKVSMKSMNEKEVLTLREQLDIALEGKSDMEQQVSKLESIKEQLRNAEGTLSGMDGVVLTRDSKIASLESEHRLLKEKTLRDAEEWKRKFDEIIHENNKCKHLLSEIRTDIMRTNAAILENHLDASKTDPQSSNKLSSLHAAALSGSSLDPFRTELVHQFGSLEAVMGKRKKLTLHELETVATSIGYTREYSKKLFYALDSRNRGFLTADQFSRPLPMLNDDLCLLTKDISL